MCAMMDSAAVAARASGLARPTAALCEPYSLNTYRSAPTRGREDIDPLPQIAVMMKYAKNQTIYYEGDEAGYNFKVLSGTVRLCKVTEDGRRQIAAFPTAGDFFGWADQGTYNYSAEAVTDVVLERYARRQVEEAVKSNPRTSHRVLALLSSQLASAQDHLLLLGRMTAEERVATFLLEWAKQCDDAMEAKATTVELPMNRRDIADYLGLTIETVSRTLSAMKRDGHISLSSTDNVRLNHRHVLERLATAA
ncbi:MAG: helix-turn-helix domain-containing protein [Pseudomonadota bacterium]